MPYKVSTDEGALLVQGGVLGPSQTSDVSQAPVLEGKTLSHFPFVLPLSGTAGEPRGLTMRVSVGAHVNWGSATYEANPGPATRSNLYPPGPEIPNIARSFTGPYCRRLGVTIVASKTM
jgi:hypothetical protein